MLVRLLLVSLTASMPLASVAAGANRLAAPPARQELVKIEVKIITTAEDFFERIGVDFNRDGTEVGKPSDREPTKSLPPTVLGNDQLRKFMESLEGDIRTNVMQAPSLIVSNGKTGVVRCMQRHESATGSNASYSTGYKVAVRPKISADRRAIALHVKMALRSLDSEKPPLLTTLSLEDQLSIPAGGSVLLGGWKRLSEGRCEYGPPVISKIPYISRLVKNVGYTRVTENVLVLVTASIVGDEGKKAAAMEPTGTKKEIAKLMKQFNVLFKEGKYAEAERCACRAHELDPDDPTATAAMSLARDRNYIEQQYYEAPDDFSLDAR